MAGAKIFSEPHYGNQIVGNTFGCCSVGSSLFLKIRCKNDDIQMGYLNDLTESVVAHLNIT